MHPAYLVLVLALALALAFGAATGAATDAASVFEDFGVFGPNPPTQSEFGVKTPSGSTRFLIARTVL